MPGFRLAEGHALLVASRGSGPEHGLTRWRQVEGAWHGKLWASIDQLSSLTRHPTLPIAYGTSGTGSEGSIHAWNIEGDIALPLGKKSSKGALPCHLAVDPAGQFLIFANYQTSTLGVQRLAPDGGFEVPAELLQLAGNGPDRGRQKAPHPHQTLFVGHTLLVADLGVDLVREFSIDGGRVGANALLPVRTTMLPAGSGPRHAVALPDGRLAISGELASTIVVGRPGDHVESWASAPSTSRTGPARTRSPRNYPGDIQRSRDGRHVYLANRGHDTISTFDVSGPTPALISELDAGVAWPEHLLVAGDHLLIAGWDSSAVAAMPLAAGRPTAAETIFACAAPGWLLLWD